MSDFNFEANFKRNKIKYRYYFTWKTSEEEEGSGFVSNCHWIKKKEAAAFIEELFSLLTLKLEEYQKWSALHFSSRPKFSVWRQSPSLNFRSFFNNNRMSNQIVNLDKVGKHKLMLVLRQDSNVFFFFFLRPFRRCSKGGRKWCSRWFSSHSNSTKERQKNSDHHPGSLFGVWP